MIQSNMEDPQAMKTYKETEGQKQRRRGKTMSNLANVIKKDLEKKGCKKEDTKDWKKWNEAKRSSPRKTGRRRKTTRKKECVY